MLVPCGSTTFLLNMLCFQSKCARRCCQTSVFVCENKRWWWWWCICSIACTTYLSWNSSNVSSLIQFKLCTLMFDINCGTAPQYQSELVRRCDDTRLRSSVRGNFIVSRILSFTWWTKLFPSPGDVPGTHFRLILNWSHRAPASARRHHRHHKACT